MRIKKNYGFSKACNIGEVQSKFDTLLFLNPDTNLNSDVLDLIFKKNIDFDEKLTKLLKPAEGEVVTYFTIQKLLKLHYVKPECESEPIPEPSPAPTPEPVETSTKEKKKTQKKNAK